MFIAFVCLAFATGTYGLKVVIPCAGTFRKLTEAQLKYESDTWYTEQSLVCCAIHILIVDGAQAFRYQGNAKSCAAATGKILTKLDPTPTIPYWVAYRGTHRVFPRT